MFDLFTIGTAVLTFAAIVAGYALFQSYRAAAMRIAREETRRLSHGRQSARMAGGFNRLGDN